MGGGRQLEGELAFSPSAAGGMAARVSSHPPPSPPPPQVLAKIDVEGYEVNALGALEPHMRAGRILNLMVEINKKGYSKGMPIEEAIKEG